VTGLLLSVGDAVVDLVVTAGSLEDLATAVLVDLSLDAGGAPAADAAAHRVALYDEPGGDTVVLEVDGRIVHRSPDPSLAFDAFMSWCNVTASRRRGHIALHAAVLAAPTGGAVVVPASAASGKTTLAVGLCRRGWAYLSDEIAAVSTDADRVVGYPKPLTVKPGTRAMLGDGELPPSRTISPRQQRWYVRPEELGGRPATAAPIEGLLFARYDGTAGARAIAHRVGVAEATLELAVHVQDPLDATGSVLVGLAALASRCRRGRVVHASLDAVCDAAAELVTGDTVDAGTGPLLLPASTPVAELGPARHPRAVSVVVADGAVVHHLDSQALLALDATAAQVWERLDGRRAVTDIAEELAAVHGADPSLVRADIEQLLVELGGNGVLSRR
jgi:hypothetical protein